MTFYKLTVEDLAFTPCSYCRNIAWLITKEDFRIELKCDVCGTPIISPSPPSPPDKDPSPSE